MFPLPLNMYFELAAFLTAAILWRSLDKHRLRWFIPFLFIIVVAEFLGRYLNKELRQPNAWIFNFVVPIEYLFYAWLFWLQFKSPFNRNIAAFFLAGFSIYTVVIYLVNGVYYFNADFLLVGSFFMILFCLLFLFELYGQSSEQKLMLNPMLWITTGLFIFNAGEFSYNLLARFFIADRNLMDPSMKLFREINGRLILVLYASFIIAFICRKITATYKRE